MNTNSTANGTAPSGAAKAVLKPSDPVPESAVPVHGLDFNQYAHRNATAAELVGAMSTMGFQASSIGEAAKIVDGMVGKSIQESRVHGRLAEVSRSGYGETLRLARGRRFSWATLRISFPPACARLSGG